jgi:pimeloyl-ACP methyl ester carboxylesterase
MKESRKRSNVAPCITVSVNSSPMSRSLLMLAAAAILVYLACCALLFAFQRSLIYFPQPPSPAIGATNLALATDGAQLQITALPRKRPDAVVYFGGNAEDVNFSLPGLAAAFPRHAIYLMHYRGYGGSSGKPSEDALVADALALFDRVSTEHPNVVVIGRSLGSGVAVHLASLRPVTRLILVTPYDSLAGLAAGQFPYFPVRWLLLDKFESWRYAARINVPTLVVAAERDEVIPRASTEALYSRFHAGVATLRVVAGASHNTISESPEYVPLLKGVQ